MITSKDSDILVTSFSSCAACISSAPYFHHPGLPSRYSDWLRAGRPGVGVRVPVGAPIFHFSASSRPALGPTQPPIKWVYGALSPGVKRPGHEADHSQLVPISINPLPQTS
jgi:hypothetical protein